MPTTTKDQTPGAELINLQKEAVDMPVLLQEAESKLAKASEYVKNFPAITDEEGKKTGFTLLNQMKDRLDTFNAERMPFTRKLNEVIKKFTGVENGWKDLVATMTKKLDDYTAAELRKARAEQAKKDAELAATQNKLAVEARYKETLRQRITDLLTAVRTAAGNLVSGVTQETLEANKTKLSAEPKWVKDKMDPFYYAVPEWVTTDADGVEFQRIATEEFPANSADYIARSKQILTDSLGIIDVALTNKAEAKRLQDLAAAEAAKKATEDADEAARDLEAQKAIAKIDMEEVAQPKAKIKAKIKILDDEAWIQIFANWWKWDTDKESDKLEKKTLLQMKTFCEKHALATGELIDHPSLEYIEEVKAKQ